MVAPHAGPPGQGYQPYSAGSYRPQQQLGSTPHRPASAGGTRQNTWRAPQRQPHPAQPSSGSSSGYQTRSAAGARPSRDSLTGSLSDVQKQNQLRVIAKKRASDEERRRMIYNPSATSQQQSQSHAAVAQAASAAAQPQTQQQPPERLPPPAQLQAQLRQQLEERAASRANPAGGAEAAGHQSLLGQAAPSHEQPQAFADQQQLEQDAERRAGSAGASTSGSELNGQSIDLPSARWYRKLTDAVLLHFFCMCSSDIPSCSSSISLSHLKLSWFAGASIPVGSFFGGGAAEAQSVEAAAAAAAADAADTEDKELESRQNMTEVPASVYVVNNRHDARRVCDMLVTSYRDCVFGADTEVRNRPVTKDIRIRNLGVKEKGGREKRSCEAR